MPLFKGRERPVRLLQGSDPREAPGEKGFLGLPGILEIHERKPGRWISGMHMVSSVPRFNSVFKAPHEERWLVVQNNQAPEIQQSLKACPAGASCAVTLLLLLPDPPVAKP